MTSKDKIKKDLEQLKSIEAKNKKVQPDPYNTHKTLYNPASGDLYISITDKNGVVRRKVINLLGD